MHIVEWAAAHPKSRLVIVGGTFDPIHNGHLALARIAEEELNGTICLLPAGDPPHKDATQASAAHRLAMTALAVQETAHAWLVGEDQAADSEPSYTVDILRALRHTAPEMDIWMVVGQDAFLEMENWWQPGQLFALACWAVALRPQDDGVLGERERVADMAAHYAAHYHAHIRLLQKAGPPVSATMLRTYLEQGLPVDVWLPGAVAAYIHSHGLYRQRGE